jgi:hypothetical protein
VGSGNLGNGRAGTALRSTAVERAGQSFSGRESRLLPSRARTELASAIGTSIAHCLCTCIAKRAFVATNSCRPVRNEVGPTSFAFPSHLKRHSV